MSFSDTLLPPDSEVFTQHGYRCRLEWGRRGAEMAAQRCDILVIIDVLRFSTTVAAAIHAGGEIFPCKETEDVNAIAAELGAVAAVKNYSPGKFSLSPGSITKLKPGTRIVLSSLNGATCSRLAARVPDLFVGALVNARAVGKAVDRLVKTQADPSRCVTVVACGERWEQGHEDGLLRFAIEDYLGAGAILAHIPTAKSPEARLCEAAFRAASGDLLDFLQDCASGRELSYRGLGSDVLFASRLDTCPSVPILRKDGWIVAQPGNETSGVIDIA